MGSIVVIALVLIYFFSGAHQKVLDYFGLSQRDDKLIFMGLFIPGFLSSFITLIALAVTGSFGSVMVGPLISTLLCGFFIYFNYKQL